MSEHEAESCIGTIELLRKVFFRMNGLMDKADYENCDKIIRLLCERMKKGDANECGDIQG